MLGNYFRNKKNREELALKCRRIEERDEMEVNIGIQSKLNEAERVGVHKNVCYKQ
jgi:hypothetical protein